MRKLLDAKILSFKVVVLRKLSILGEKSLVSQIEEKEKILSESVLREIYAEGRRYAADPTRFVLFAFDLNMHTEQDNHLVLYDHKDWSCSCDFYKEKGICSHIAAVSFLLERASLSGGPRIG